MDRLARYLAITLSFCDAAVAGEYKRRRQRSHATSTTVSGFTLQACANMRSSTNIMFSAGFVKIITPLDNTGARHDLMFHKNFRYSACDSFPRKFCDFAVAAITGLSRCPLVTLVHVLVMPVIAGLHIVSLCYPCHFFGSRFQLAVSPFRLSWPAGAREDLTRSIHGHSLAVSLNRQGSHTWLFALFVLLSVCSGPSFGMPIGGNICSTDMGTLLAV